MSYQQLSLWLDGVGDSLDPRPALPGDRDADVVIIGAGFTGLWTAYYLAKADPALRIVILEAEIAGFGASGRNGGWCSELFPASSAKIARSHGRPAALQMRAAMRETVAEIARVIEAEGLECGFAYGGTVSMARSRTQWARAQADVAEAASWGDTDTVLLGSRETSDIIGATNLLGGAFTPHCAALDPARLVRGLAELVERLGVTLYERSRVRSTRPTLPSATRARYVRMW
ncbi:NAD(P)/FAD-dependent oxidoreductase [Nakamurella antarctica]|uniref:NAD(P)/FAD-dependent oxidoreductase n=1 Tax=Nakamurella antarctica TaxID=1902245 RepID=UPI0019D0B4BD|nr:FAD-dependent oxidoreductase [Nakamurella antarctica]